MTALCHDGLHAPLCSEHNLLEPPLAHFQREKGGDESERISTMSGKKSDASSPPLVNSSIKIWQQRVSALSARSLLLVIPSLRWEDGAGFGVNTQRALGCLSVMVAKSSMSPPAQPLSFHRVRGVTIFPPGETSFFSSHTMNALCPLNENRSPQWAFHWVSVRTEGQWIKKSAFFFIKHPFGTHTQKPQLHLLWPPTSNCLAALPPHFCEVRNP